MSKNTKDWHNKVYNTLNNHDYYVTNSEYTKKAYLKLAEGKTISCMLNYANSEGKISRSTAQKALKQMFIDSELDNLRVCYEEIKSKLPKARLKGAAKWFGLGIGISILSNMVFSLFRKEPASK